MTLNSNNIMAKKITMVHSGYDTMIIGPREEEEAYTLSAMERNMDVRRWTRKSKNI